MRLQTTAADRMELADTADDVVNRLRMALDSNNPYIQTRAHNFVMLR
jgi:hypothetical protein